MKDVIGDMYPGNRIATLASTLAIVVGMGMSGEAQAVSTESRNEGVDGNVFQGLSLNTQNGNARCTIDLFTRNSLRSSFSAILRVEEYTRGKWRINPEFDDSVSVNQYDEPRNRVGAKIRNKFDIDELAAEAQIAPMRLACLSGETQITLRIPKKSFD